MPRLSSWYEMVCTFRPPSFNFKPRKTNASAAFLKMHARRWCRRPKARPNLSCDHSVSSLAPSPARSSLALASARAPRTSDFHFANSAAMLGPLAQAERRPSLSDPHEKARPHSLRGVWSHACEASVIASCPYVHCSAWAPLPATAGAPSSRS